MTFHSLVIQKLLNTNAQIGRRVAAHHFKQYAYGIRNNLTIVDSDKTLICLRSACNFISALARNPTSSFLFINTNPLFEDIVDLLSAKVSSLSSSHSNTIWRRGGFLTNSFVPRKFRSRKKKLRFGLTELPDCVVIFDTERKSSAITEAYKMHIPIVALVDSHMPWECYKKITYPVPANDSVQFVYLFCNMIAKCIALERKKAGAIGRLASTGQKIKQIEDASSESKIGRDEVLVIPYDDLPPIAQDNVKLKELLDKLVVVKFNGDLGTNMGFDGPKCLIEVHKGSTSLDLLINQIQFLNTKYGCNVPLLLVNTSDTLDDISKVVEKYSNSNIDIHLLKQDVFDEEEIEDANIELQRHPSEQDTAFLSLMTKGTLDLLLSKGKEYAFLVNSDNAAARIDSKILNHLSQNNIQFCMEVIGVKNSTDNTERGNFKLADVAQHMTKRSAKKFKLIDTRSSWIDLRVVKGIVDTGALKMDDLYNSKTVDRRRAAANGAIRFFDQAIGVNVPQSRFLPLNSTSELLLLQSDLYTIRDGALVQNGVRSNPVKPLIQLGPEFDTISDFQSRFKATPSIIQLDSLQVTGDVIFGADVSLKGRVTIMAEEGMKIRIPDGSVLINKVINSPADL